MNSLSNIYEDLKKKGYFIRDFSQQNATRSDAVKSLPKSEETRLKTSTEPQQATEEAYNPNAMEPTLRVGAKYPEENLQQILNRNVWMGNKTDQTSVNPAQFSPPEKGSFLDKATAMTVKALTSAFPIFKATDDPVQQTMLDRYGVERPSLKDVPSFIMPFAPVNPFTLALTPVFRAIHEYKMAVDPRYRLAVRPWEDQVAIDDYSPVDNAIQSFKDAAPSMFGFTDESRAAPMSPSDYSLDPTNPATPMSAYDYSVDPDLGVDTGFGSAIGGFGDQSGFGGLGGFSGGALGGFGLGDNSGMTGLGGVGSLGGEEGGTSSADGSGDAGSTGEY